MMQITDGGNVLIVSTEGFSFQIDKDIVGEFSIDLSLIAEMMRDFPNILNGVIERIYNGDESALHTLAYGLCESMAFALSKVKHPSEYSFLLSMVLAAKTKAAGIWRIVDFLEILKNNNTPKEMEEVIRVLLEILVRMVRMEELINAPVN